MQTIGKTIRGSLPAIGLGLISAFGVAAVATLGAPAAVAQIKAKKEFVENFNAASAAKDAKNWQVVIDKTDAAYPHAADNQQKLALEQLRVLAYASLKQTAQLIKSLETALALGAPPELAKPYKQMLASAYNDAGDQAKALQLTKEFIDQYGGDSGQYAYLAKDALDAKNYDAASSYAQKAIQQTQKEGKPASSVHYNLLLRAYFESNNLNEYYKALETAAPLLNKPEYWRALIDGARHEPKFKRDEAQLDVYRTIEQAKAPLKPEEQKDMGEMALNAGNSIEAERVLAAYFANSASNSDADAERYRKFYAKAQADAKADKAGGLAQSEKEAAAKPTGVVYVRTGEAYLGAGDYAKAVELIKKGLDKGGLEPGAAELAELRLGIAQYKAGQKDEARKTWEGVTGDNGSAWLAKVWTLLAKV